MIKRIFDKITRYSLVLLILFGYILLPFNVSAAKEPSLDNTLGDLKGTLKEYKAKEQAQKNAKKKTESEIKQNYDNIRRNEEALENTKVEINNVEAEITHTNDEITSLKSETEELLRIYQKLENDNFYMEYVTGANTITDLIMRMDAIKKLTEYNEQKLDELEMLIKSNEKLENELEKYQVKLDNQIVAYEESIEQLNGQLEELEEGMVTIQDDIATLNYWVQHYTDLGCKDNQKLSTCLDIGNNTRWVKPVTQGRITSLYGKRTSPTAGASSYHRGIDIGVGEGTNVYPTANGIVGAIVRKSSCGGNMLYIWVTVNGKQYTTVFMHLLSINVNVGDKVTINQVVAKSGGGKSTASKYGGYDRCTTGAHLHYGVASGGFYGSSKATPLSSFNSHTIVPPGFPGLYQWFYSRW